MSDLPSTSPGPAGRIRPKDRRAQILEAAVELFRDRGYHAVGVIDIGHAVGVTGAAVYRHYATKEDILMAVLHQSLDQTLEALQDVSENPASRHLERMVGAMVTAMSDAWELAVIFRSEIRSLSDSRLLELMPKQLRIREVLLPPALGYLGELDPWQLDLLFTAQLGAVATTLEYCTAADRRRNRARATSAAMMVLSAGPLPRLLPRFPETRSPKAVVRASRRERVLSVAVERFASRGFGTDSMDSIGDEAGVTGPAVYHHFVSKEALLEAAVNRASSLLLASISSVLAQEVSHEDRLGALVDAFMDLLHQHRSLFSVYFFDEQHLNKRSARVPEPALEVLFDEWTRLLRAVRPQLSADDAARRVKACVGACVSVMLTEVSGRSGLIRYDCRPSLRKVTEALHGVGSDFR